jgi:lambda family phage portal protein
MTWLTKLLRWPGQGEASPQVRQWWDAAGSGSRLANWNAPSTNWVTSLGSEALKRRARDEYRNGAFARRIIELLVTDVVGSGIKPQFSGDGKSAATEAWNRWTDECDSTGRFDLYGFEQAVLRTTAIDGECLVRMIPTSGPSVPLTLQALPGEFLDSSRVDSNTLNGIEYDAAGQRAAYWLFTRHPAQAVNPQSVRVPAEQVVHVFLPFQPGLERGTSWLAPALLPLRELREYTEVSLVRAKTAALFSGFVSSQDGANPINQSGAPNVSLEPGSMVFLSGGQTVEFAQPPDVGQTFDPAIRAYLRAIAAATGLPYSLLSGDFSQTTFAAGRHELLSYRRVLETVQHHLLVFQLLRPVLSMWARLAVATGALPGVPEDYLRVRWIAPILSALDPKGETQAQIARIRAGLTSRTEVVSQDGWDVSSIDDELAAERARETRLGLVLDSNPAQTSLQGQQQTSATSAQES